MVVVVAVVVVIEVAVAVAVVVVVVVVVVVLVVVMIVVSSGSNSMINSTSSGSSSSSSSSRNGNSGCCNDSGIYLHIGSSAISKSQNKQKQCLQSFKKKEEVIEVLIISLALAFVTRKNVIVAASIEVVAAAIAGLIIKVVAEETMMQSNRTDNACNNVRMILEGI